RQSPPRRRAAGSRPRADPSPGRPWGGSSWYTGEPSAKASHRRPAATTLRGGSDMRVGPREERRNGADLELDEGFMSTVDAGAAVTTGSPDGAPVTPDPFLAEVARIPAREDVPLPGPGPRPGDRLGRFTLLSEI